MKLEARIEIMVGIFILMGLLAFLFLVFSVSGNTNFIQAKGFTVTADFDHVGDLKVRAPVTIAGVRVGEVSKITLNPETQRAHVSMYIDNRFNKIPLFETCASILTAGLVGSNYVAIEPGSGIEEEGKTVEYLKEGSQIEITNRAVILENLIAQLLFKLNSKE